METQKDQVREVLYSKALAGQRAKFALEELREFLVEAKEALFRAMLIASTPEEAWTAAQKYKAYEEFTNRCETSVLAGMEANERIIGGY